MRRASSSSPRVVLVPSWPPSIHRTATGTPRDASVRALASDCSMPKRVSAMPCTSSVGAVAPSSTALGLCACSNATSSGLGVPVSAAVRNNRQTAGSKRPHTGFGDGVEVAGERPARSPEPSAGAAAEPKKRDAHSCLNGPSAATRSTSPGVWAASGVTANCGKNASARSFHVTAGTTASMRGSVAAAMSTSAPPYDAPAAPTRGSPGPSRRTSGRAASRSTSRRASATSYAGSLR